MGPALDDARTVGVALERRREVLARLVGLRRMTHSQRAPKHARRLRPGTAVAPRNAAPSAKLLVARPVPYAMLGSAQPRVSPPVRLRIAWGHHLPHVVQSICADQVRFEAVRVERDRLLRVARRRLRSHSIADNVPHAETKHAACDVRRVTGIPTPVRRHATRPRVGAHRVVARRTARATTRVPAQMWPSPGADVDCLGPWCGRSAKRVGVRWGAVRAPRCL